MHTTYTLEAEFGKSDGKSHRLKIKEFDPTKSADEIKTALTKLTKLNLFEKNGVGLFKEVRHAKVIERTETPIFDEGKMAADPHAAVMTEEAASRQVPVQPTASQRPIRVPEDLTITEEWPKPDQLIQTIELPAGLHSWDLSESQGFMLLQACLPSHVSLEEMVADDASSPAKLIVTGKLEADVPKPVHTTALNQESSPPKPKKKRRRLLDRIRKRE